MPEKVQYLYVICEKVAYCGKSILGPVFENALENAQCADKVILRYFNKDLLNGQINKYLFYYTSSLQAIVRFMS